MAGSKYPLMGSVRPQEVSVSTGFTVTANQLFLGFSVKFDVNIIRPPQARKQCCENTVAETLFPRRANGETFAEETKCVRNKCFLSAKTGKNLGKQQCFLVCGGLYNGRKRSAQLFSRLFTRRCGQSLCL